MDARLYNQSRCVQKYSYSYALVRKPAATEIPQHRARREGQGFSVPGAGGWSMDYVRVRSGCECQITPPKRKTPHKKRERHRQKKKNRRLEEEDETWQWMCPVNKQLNKLFALPMCDWAYVLVCSNDYLMYLFSL